MMKRSLVAGMLAVGLALASPVAANADDATSGWANADERNLNSKTVENVGGGLWEYGVSGGYVASNYHHASKYHTSSACSGALGNPCTQAAAAAGAWSKASRSAWIAGNKAWWNTY